MILFLILMFVVPLLLAGACIYWAYLSTRGGGTEGTENTAVEYAKVKDCDWCGGFGCVDCCYSGRRR